MTTEDIQGHLPPALEVELTKMRRNPAMFHAGGKIQCRFCGKPNTAYALLDATSGNEAGSRCPLHGWLYFDSVKFPPTERLTAGEIEDRRLSERRREAAQRRKEAGQ